MLIAAGMSGMACCFKNSGAKASAVLIATLAGMILCGFFAGRSPWGFYNNHVTIEKFADHSEQIKVLKKLIPAGKSIQTTLGYQAHFAGRNPVESFAGTQTSDRADYLIIPSGDIFTEAEVLQKITENALGSKQWKCIAVDPNPQRKAAIFVRVNRR